MRNFNFEILLIICKRSTLSIKLLWYRQILKLSKSSLVKDLILCLLQLFILEVKCFAYHKSLFSVTVISEGIHYLWQLSFTDESVLKLSDIFINENNEAFMNSKLKR